MRISAILNARRSWSIINSCVHAAFGGSQAWEKDMKTLALRFVPGTDLRSALAALLAQHGAQAGYVIQGIGSLCAARIRFAGRDDLAELSGDLELLTLGGSLAPDGVHLHLSVANSEGHVTGGHMGAGCIVRTTAEVLVALLPDYRFSREPDPASGFKELAIRPAP
jgi:predicted DNA-binding protein with PD1-like motif